MVLWPSRIRCWPCVAGLPIPNACTSDRKTGTCACTCSAHLLFACSASILGTGHDSYVMRHPHPLPDSQLWITRVLSPPTVGQAVASRKVDALGGRRCHAFLTAPYRRLDKAVVCGMAVCLLRKQQPQPKVHPPFMHTRTGPDVLE